MKALSLLFFSSSPISMPLLTALLADERFLVKGLFCQPDKPAGRGQKITSPETKLLAQQKNIPVFQSENLRSDLELLNDFKSDPPDFLITFAYGQILSLEWLNLPRLAPLNVHASLLPLYRGASPIQGALLEGQTKTGLSLMKMERGMDTGPVAFQHELLLTEDMFYDKVFEELGELAAKTIPGDLLKLAEDLHFSPQDEALSTITKKISKADAFLDFNLSQEEILKRFRAYTTWPGLWTTYKGARLKLLMLQKSMSRDLSAGQIFFDGNSLRVGTIDGDLKILALQLEGKKPLSALEFMKGAPDFHLSVLPS